MEVYTIAIQSRHTLHSHETPCLPNNHLFPVAFPGLWRYTGVPGPLDLHLARRALRDDTLSIELFTGQPKPLHMNSVTHLGRVEDQIFRLIVRYLDVSVFCALPLLIHVLEP